MIIIILANLSNVEFQSLKKGDETVYVKIYNKYKKPIYNLLLVRSSGNRELAQDVMQETFLTAMKSFSRLKSPGHLEAWLVTIAKNKLIDSFRKSSRDKKYIEKIAESESGSHDPDSELHEKEQVALLHLAMEKINPLHKKLLKMRCWEDIKVKDIAKRIGRTPKAVENMLYRAKESLKKQITAIYKDLER